MSPFVRNSLTERSEIYYRQADIYELFSAAEDADDKVLDVLRREARGKAVLDLGCGTGKYVGLLAPCARHVTGLDAAPGQLAIARERTSRHANVTLLQGDAADMDFSGLRVDMVMACWVLGTIIDEKRRMRIISRASGCLESGGAFWLVENNSRGTFEEIRGRIPMSAAYNRWLEETAGFRIAEEISTKFRFESESAARMVFSRIWGESVGAKVPGAEIPHEIVMFRK